MAESPIGCPICPAVGGKRWWGGVKQAGTRMIFKQPTAVQWFGKLCGSLSQGGELIGDFSSACREREPLVLVPGGARGSHTSHGHGRSQSPHSVLPGSLSVLPASPRPRVGGVSPPRQAAPAQNPHTGHSQQIWGADLHEGDNRCPEVLVFLRRGSPRTRPSPGETAGQRGDARERESSKSHLRVAVFPAGWPLIQA